MIFGSGYDQAGAMLLNQQQLAEQHALNQARMEADAAQFAARQRAEEDANRFRFAQFAANRADERARLDQSRASFDFQKAVEANRQAAQNREIGWHEGNLANQTRQIDWQIKQPSPAAIRDQEFAFKDATALADAGRFKSLADVQAAYPSLGPSEHGALWRRNVEAVRQLGEESAIGTQNANLLNTAQNYEDLLKLRREKDVPFFSRRATWVDPMAAELQPVIEAASELKKRKGGPEYVNFDLAQRWEPTQSFGVPRTKARYTLVNGIPAVETIEDAELLPVGTVFYTPEGQRKVR